MRHSRSALTGRTARRRVAAAVLVAIFTVSIAQPQAQTKVNKDQIWERAEPAVMEYMKESAGMIASGFGLAYSGFIDWYTNVLIPSTGKDPAVVEVAKFVFETVLKGVKLVPGVGQLTKVVIDIFIDAFKKATEDATPQALSASFMAKLNARMEEAKTRNLALARRFEMDHPSDFEAAMFAYLNEEVATPGIHAASDFGIGAATRKKIASLGFPEPSEDGARQIAESVLTPMVLAVQKRYYPQRSKIFDEGQLRVVAQIEVRRYLYPGNRTRICKDAFLLGLLAPDDCR